MVPDLVLPDQLLLVALFDSYVHVYDRLGSTKAEGCVVSLRVG